MFNQPTDAVAQWGAGIPGFASSLATMTDGKFIMAAGGWPIRIGGATIGGIGVSGGNAAGRDDEIARAGLAAIEAAAPPVPASPSYSNVASSALSPQSIPQPPGNVPQQNEFPRGPLPTQHLTPEQGDPYADDSFSQFDKDRSGGQL
jgi:hypothetical protein